MSRVVDLTLDSSPIPVRSNPAPVEAKKNKNKNKNDPIHDGGIHPALLEAIRTIDADRLRQTLIDVLPDYPDLMAGLSRMWLVLGKDVVRYHVDTSDEDRSESEESDGVDEDTEADESELEAERVAKLSRIRVKNEEMTPRFAKCDHCKEEFDVSTNERGDCIWHPGHKDVDHDNDFWDDHDEDCHGTYESHIDDSDFAGGFSWSCCNEDGDNEGCKKTKHRALVNTILAPTKNTKNTKKTKKTKKRKLEDAEERPLTGRCVNCHERFEIEENGPNVCKMLPHDGGKTVDYESDFWADHDERCHGRMDSFVDDPSYEPGFMWDCCEKAIDDEGCNPGRHDPRPGSIR